MTPSLVARRDEIGLKDGQLLIDGRWRSAASSETWTHIHPATGEEIGDIAVAGVSDVDDAVTVARRAFDDGRWSNTRAGERVKALHRYADLLREHADELGEELM